MNKTNIKDDNYTDDDNDDNCDGMISYYIDYQLSVYYNKIIHIMFVRMLMLSLCAYMSFHSNIDLQTQISFHLFLQFSGTRQLSRQSLQSNVGPSFANCPWMWQHAFSSLTSDCWDRSQSHPLRGKCALVPSRTAARQSTAMNILNFACLNVSHITVLIEKMISYIR